MRIGAYVILSCYSQYGNRCHLLPLLLLSLHPPTSLSLPLTVHCPSLDCLILEVSNEGEVVAALRSLEGQTFPNGAAVRFQDVDYNVLSFKEQIKIDLGTLLFFSSFSLPSVFSAFCYCAIFLFKSFSLPCPVQYCISTLSPKHETSLTFAFSIAPSYVH